MHEVYIAQEYGFWKQGFADPSFGTFSLGPSSVFLIIDGAELFRGQQGPEPTPATWIERAAEHADGRKIGASNARSGCGSKLGTPLKHTVMNV